MSASDRAAMLDRRDEQLSVRRQCALLGSAREDEVLARQAKERLDRGVEVR